MKGNRVLRGEEMLHCQESLPSKCHWDGSRVGVIYRTCSLGIRRAATPPSFTTLHLVQRGKALGKDKKEKRKQRQRERELERESRRRLQKRTFAKLESV